MHAFTCSTSSLPSFGGPPNQSFLVFLFPFPLPVLLSPDRRVPALLSLDILSLPYITDCFLQCILLIVVYTTVETSGDINSHPVVFLMPLSKPQCLSCSCSLAAGCLPPTIEVLHLISNPYTSPRFLSHCTSTALKISSIQLQFAG